MKRIFEKTICSLIALLLTGTSLLDVPVLAIDNLSTLDNDTILACSWIPKYDDKCHWEECANHHDTGEYNGELHNEGKRNVEPHDFIVTKQPDCRLKGEARCNCGYTKPIDKLDHIQPADGKYTAAGEYNWCQGYCSRCKQVTACKGCDFIWVVKPTTTQAGTMKCKDCGKTYSPSKLMVKLKTTCPCGGEHELPQVNKSRWEFPDHLEEGDFIGKEDGEYLRCTKCNELVKVKNHNTSKGYCIHCMYRNVRVNQKIVSRSGNTATVEVEFLGATVNSIIRYTPYSVNGYMYGFGSSVTSFTKIAPNKFRFVWTKTKNMTLYGGVTGQYYLNTSIGTIYQDVWADEVTYFDISSPTIISKNVTPDPISTWSNVKVITLVAKDTESAQLQCALYKDNIEILPYRSMSKDTSGNYITDLYVQGVYPTDTIFEVRVKDIDQNITSSNITISKLENEAPTITYTLSHEGLTSKDVIIKIKAHDNHSGVNRIKLPNGTFIKSDTCEYKVSENGTYTFRAEDNIGNACTKVINIINKVSLLTADITYSDFIISNPDVPGSLLITNTSPICIKVILKQVKPLSDDFTLVSRNKFSEQQWADLGLIESKKYIALGLRENSNITWLNNVDLFEIPILPKETKQFQIITKSGHSFKEQYNIKYELLFEIEGTE